MFRTNFIFLAASLSCFGQGIASVQCWGHGGNSCSENRFFNNSGDLYCSCNALCTNTNQVNASYEVFWNCSGPHSGRVNSVSESYGVKVEGDLLNNGTNMYVGAGYDYQNCDGARSGNDFFGPC